MVKLVPVLVNGIYKTPDGRLPPHMAKLTPDAAQALEVVRKEIEAGGGCFRLSDCYRSPEMQRKAYLDWKIGRKKAYSPPPGGSMHEAGRAIDLDLAALIHPPSIPKGFKLWDEHQVRTVFEKHGWTFITKDVGNPHQVDTTECWHIEFRGPFHAVYAAQGYKGMVKAAIADVGV